MKIETQLTAVEWLVSKLFNHEVPLDEDIYNAIEQAKEMEKEEKEKLWTNEEVFDMLYKTDKFLMIQLREYWKTIEK
jgi:hypothetical protein